MAESRPSLRAIFNEASEIAPGEARQAYLDRVCGGDAALRANVEELLRIEQSAGGFLADPDRSATILVAPVTEDEGDRIGRYKLLEKVGEGGCGVVFVAEQTEPVRRRVAVKVIKLGMDTKQVVARFEAERQALAMMDHPNIAKVLDAGTTDRGRPYFVMELVRGIKITEYCDQNNLTTQERLDLFIKVCHAIQHAHQKGIIHRDIKPSNILVTVNDGAPVPKVIDFGIAKATEGRLTEATVYTQLHQFIGTPAYMSPEQAEMTSLDIDTRSDIYSLGVLLYEILAGATPFDPQELMASGIDAMRKAIREKEPLRPSTRLATLHRDELTTTAKRRAVEAPRLIHLLKGDLDWIVMKCLEKDRTRRYDTANSLALDLERHLGNEPVAARPPSTMYRMQKLMRRNKLAFAAGSAMVTLLLLGIAASLWQAARANREAARANQEASRALQAEAVAKERLAEVGKEQDAKEKASQDAEAVSTFLTDVFQSPDATKAGRTITVAETLDRAAKKLESDPAVPPARRARLEGTLGRTYYNLGLYGEAAALQEKVRDYYTATFGPENTNTLWAVGALAISDAGAGRQDEALKLQEQLLLLSQKVRGPENLDTLNAMNNLAVFYRAVGRSGEALKLYEEALPLYRKAVGLEKREAIHAMNNLASAYDDAGRHDEALKLHEQALEIDRRVLGSEDPDTLDTMWWVADSYYEAGRTNEALKLKEHALELERKVLGPEHPATLSLMNSLAVTYYNGGRMEEALKLGEQALELDRKVHGTEASETFTAMNELATVYDSVGRTNEALKLREQMAALSQKVVSSGDSNAITVIANFASSYDNVGRTNEALKLREQALELDRKALGPENQKTLTAMGDLALSYDNTGRHDEAATLEEQLLPLSQKVRGPEDRETLGVMNHLAIFYEKAGRTNEALKLREQALPLDRKTLGPDSPDTLSAINELARFYADAGRNEERLKLTEEALGLSVKNDPDSEATGDNYAWYGYALDAVGRGDEAIKAWQEAVRIGPAARQREAHYRLGRNLMKRKRYAEALPSLRTAQEQYPYDDRGLEAGGLLAFAEAVTSASENPQEGSTRGAPASGPFTAWLTAVRAPVDASAVVDERAMHLATLYCWLGRTNEHQALCRKLLELAGPSQDPGPHDLAAKACLVLAHPGPELLKLAIASGRQGLALAATNNQYRTWFLITAGLAELRDAQPARAEARLTEALSDSNIIPDQHALALAYRTIARAQLGQTNEARADFAALEKLAPPLPPHDSFSPGLAEINPLITCIAYEEAKAILNPPGAPHP